MPRTPMVVSASRTSSSLNGLIVAIMSFTFFPLRICLVDPKLGFCAQEDVSGGAEQGNGRKSKPQNLSFCTIFAQITALD
jgi:hypothetical protein